MFFISSFYVAKMVNDNIAWENAREQNTPEAYDFYSANFNRHLSNIEPLREKAVIESINTDAPLNWANEYLNSYGTSGCCYDEFCESIKKIMLEKQVYFWYDYYLQLPDLKESSIFLDSILVLADNSMWQLTKTNKDWEAYLNRFKNGINQQQALSMLEEQNWQESLSLNTKDAYLNYLREWPKGKYLEKANNKIHEFDWITVKNNNNFSEYDSFLSNNPNSVYSNEAKKLMEQCFVTDLINGVCYTDIPNKLKNKRNTSFYGSWKIENTYHSLNVKKDNIVTNFGYVFQKRSFWFKNSSYICLVVINTDNTCTNYIYEIIKEKSNFIETKCLRNCRHEGNHIFIKTKDAQGRRIKNNQNN